MDNAISGIVLSCMLAAAILASCGQHPSRDLEAENSNIEQLQSASDLEWARVLDSDQGRSNVDVVTVEELLCQGMLHNIHLRNAGNDFWDSYPDDPRRFDWLTMTVALSPSVVGVSGSSFTGFSEDNLENCEIPNASIDDDDWEERYRNLRSEFFGAGGASDVQRRSLQMYELEQEIIKAALSDDLQRDLRGEILSNAGSFFDLYGDRLGPGDRQFDLVIKRILFLLFDEFQSEFAWTADELTQFFAVGRSSDVETGGYYQALKKTSSEPAADGRPVDAGEITGLENVADQSWMSLPVRYSLPRGGAVFDYVYAYREIMRRRLFRETGIRLWFEAPDRARQADWMARTLEAPPIYEQSFSEQLNSAERGVIKLGINPLLSQQWRPDFEIFRDDFWNDPLTPEIKKTKWLSTELGILGAAIKTNVQSGTSSDSDLDRFLAGIHGLYTEFSEPYEAYKLANDVLSYPDRFGVGERELASFVDAFQYYEDTDLQAIYASYVQRQTQMRVPLDFAGPLFGGGFLDLSHYRGDIVYIDPWTTTCKACIEAMPELHATYLEYRDRGFTFVSVVYDGTSRPRFVERVLEENDLSWPVVIGDEQRSTVLGAGGYFPYMVLDRDGTVHEYHDRKERSLADILDEMLDRERSE